MCMQIVLVLAQGCLIYLTFCVYEGNDILRASAWIDQAYSKVKDPGACLVESMPSLRTTSAYLLPKYDYSPVMLYG
jgi:hypothetical protein